MTDDVYMIAITALLPLMAVLLVLQVNPYQALVIRGILGAIAALVYTLYGAADVALTEALVGTMLSITLYAIAVRSSMIVRVGVIASDASEATLAERTGAERTGAEGIGAEAGSKSLPEPVLAALEKVLDRHHVRVELLSYPDASTLTSALKEKKIHVTYEPSGLLQTRVERLYTILQSGLPPVTSVAYFDLT